MPRKRTAWYEFTSEMPAGLALKEAAVKTLAERVEDIRKSYKAKKIAPKEAISELNKLYINFIMPGKETDQVSAEHKVMLNYAFMTLSGERNKMERRRSIVLSFLGK